MHLYIAGINGAGMSPLAEIVHQLGYQISGSDLQNSEFIETIKTRTPRSIINIGQTAGQISRTHAQKPIDWYIYSSALAWASPPNQELAWAKKNLARVSKRDEFLNFIIKNQKLKLFAITGSHGKTTTTAMLIWASQKLGLNPSSAVGGKLINQPSARLLPESQWFIYEADEFDRNFLAFEPDLSIITGIEHDHHEIYPTKASYYQEMIEFIKQSQKVIMHQADWQILNQFQSLDQFRHIFLMPKITKSDFQLLGRVNRLNAEVVRQSMQIWQKQLRNDLIVDALNQFPSLWRRFEQIAPNIYTDYAHNIAKIKGCLQIASELQKPLAVIYEPHSNLRQHHIRLEYVNLFKPTQKLYWLPTHLARENQNLKLLSPETLTKDLNYPEIIAISEMDNKLIQSLKADIKNDWIIVGMSAGNLDSWLRQHFGQYQYLKF